MDNLTKEQRSKNMSRIRSKNTKPEVIFRKKLHSLGYRYSLHKKELPGKPDLYLKKYNLAIFIHGCFWHQHGCRYSVIPKSNIKYWEFKLKNNTIQYFVHENLKKYCGIFIQNVVVFNILAINHLKSFPILVM